MTPRVVTDDEIAQLKAAATELSKWRVWRKGHGFVLAHAVDGDGPTHAEWIAIGDALTILQPDALLALAAQAQRDAGAVGRLREQQAGIEVILGQLRRATEQGGAGTETMLVPCERCATAEQEIARLRAALQGMLAYYEPTGGCQPPYDGCPACAARAALAPPAKETP